MAAEYALRAQRLPRPGLLGLERLQRLPAFFGQLGGVAEIDGDPLRGAQVGFRRRRRHWCPARLGGVLDGAQSLDQSDRGGGAGHQGSAQRRLEGCGADGVSAAHLARRFRRGRLAPGSRVPPFGYRHRALAVSGQAMGNVLLHHHVKIGAAEAEGADAGAAHAVGRFGPRPQRRVDLRAASGRNRYSDWDARSVRWAAARGRAMPAPPSKRWPRRPRPSGARCSISPSPARSCGHSLPCSASTAAMLSTSTTSPTLVEVPWPSNSVAVAGESPGVRPRRARWRSSGPTGLGAVMPLPLPSLEAADGRESRRRSCPRRARRLPGASAGRRRAPSPITKPSAPSA